MFRVICKRIKRTFRLKAVIYTSLFVNVLLTLQIFDCIHRKEKFVDLRLNLQKCSQLHRNLVGALKVTNKHATLKRSHAEPSVKVLSTYTTDGRGRWFPVTCQPRQRIVIIIPFRDRDDHLKDFIEHYVPIFQRQLLDYTILVVEQDYTHRFNRGMLLNAGYQEALSLRDGNEAPLCLILHDVDLLLEDDRLIYECSQNPTHLSVGIDTFQYRLFYDWLFGGVVAILGEQFYKTNGFSNLFYGWGGEDDDFRWRLGKAGLSPVHHNDHAIARYTMMSHGQVKKNNDRISLWLNGYERYHCDGLNSLDYIVSSTQYKNHYILIKINLPAELKTSNVCQNCFLWI